VPAERGDRVDQDERIVLARHCRQLLNRVEHAGRRLGVHHRDDVRRMRRQMRTERPRVARSAPFHLEPCDRCTVALADLRQAIPEVPGDDHEHARARRHEVGHSGFHPGRARTRHGKGEGALGRSEHPCQPGSDVIEQREHQRIEMAQRR
jgi:hypothetical protein